MINIMRKNKKCHILLRIISRFLDDFFKKKSSRNLKLYLARFVEQPRPVTLFSERFSSTGKDIWSR